MEVGNPSNTIVTPGINDPWTAFTEPPFIGFSENASHLIPADQPIHPGFPSGGISYNVFPSGGQGFRDFVVFNGIIIDHALTPAMIPIPAALWMFAVAVSGLVFTRRRTP